MSENPTVTIRQNEAGTWRVEVPVPDRIQPALLVAESEDAALQIAHFVGQQLAAGLLSPKS